MKKERNKAVICVGMILMILGLAFGGFPLITGGFEGKNILYAVIGMIVFSAGTADIIHEIRRTKAVNDLINRNEYVYADFDSVRENQQDNRSTYSAVFRYKDEEGKIHFFKSKEYSDLYSIPFKQGDMARVFVDVSNPKVYVVSSNEKSDFTNQLNSFRGRRNRAKKIAAGLIIGGAAFILVPFIMGITVLITKEAVLPLFILMFIFFGVFSVIGTTSILKGVTELRK